MANRKWQKPGWWFSGCSVPAESGKSGLAFAFCRSLMARERVMAGRASVGNRSGEGEVPWLSWR